jgi:catechol 2,3-dioxygenase-like lactoylglutathione lyase family enzyme
VSTDVESEVEQMDAVKSGSAVSLIQIALNTIDLPGSLRFYAEIFGFVNGGGIPIWGGPMQLQGLDSSARGMMWWLVGRQKFFQLEIFQHTRPEQMLQPADWRPCDHGWTRFGISVSDIDSARTGLALWGITPLGELTDANGTRRLAFRDPFVGAIVEVMEFPHEAGTNRSNSPDAAVVYASFSVADLEDARTFYGEVLGFALTSRDSLHGPEHEALWGLAGAKVDGFVVESGQVRVEVVHYAEPNGRPKPANYQICDQGVMNVALGSRDIATIEALVQRVRAFDIHTTPPFEGDGSLVTYLTELNREVEIISLPETIDAEWGFVASRPFLGLDA